MRSYLRILASVVLLLLAGCGVSRPIPTPTVGPVPPGGAILPATTTAPVATPTPAAEATAGSPVSPLPTPPISPLATPQTGAAATPAGSAGAAGALSPAAQAAIAALAAKVNLDASQVQVVSAEPVEWPDACLGVQQPGQMCAQVITPGYKIVLSTALGQVEVHTDQTGRAVRVVSP